MKNEPAKLFVIMLFVKIIVAIQGGNMKKHVYPFVFFLVALAAAFGPVVMTVILR